MTQAAPKKCQVCSLFYDKGNFCAKLSDDELVSLNADSQTLAVKRGDSMQDEMLDRWPILAISTGVLSLQHLLNDGRKTIAALFMRGDILDLRTPANRKQGSLVALSNVNLCRLSPTVFGRIMDNNTIARVVAWESLSSQAFRAINHGSDLAKKRALEKLASFIFECHHRNEKTMRRDHVEIPIRRRDLAEYLGMQPETVSRSFKELEEKGIIRVSDMSIIQVLSTSILRRIANGDRDVKMADPMGTPNYKIMTARAE